MSVCVIVVGKRCVLACLGLIEWIVHNVKKSIYCIGHFRYMAPRLGGMKQKKFIIHPSTSM